MMWPYVLEYLGVCLPILAFAYGLITLFVCLRQRFSVRVNCWFCNQWTRVDYEQKDCFECPSCLQYNGFDKNGGYNKTIYAQYEEGFNQKSHAAKTVKRNTTPSNGLCSFCNHKQELKVAQLASFEPLNLNNFDKEVEHFQKQLEKAYQLCERCDQVSKQMILFKNQKLGFKFVWPRPLVSGPIWKQHRLPLLSKILKLIIIIIVITILTSLKSLPLPIPESITAISSLLSQNHYLSRLFLSVQNVSTMIYSSKLIMTILSQFPHVLLKHVRNLPILLPASGLILHLLYILCSDRRIIKALQLVLWSPFLYPTSGFYLDLARCLAGILIISLMWTNRHLHLLKKQQPNQSPQVQLSCDKLPKPDVSFQTFASDSKTTHTPKSTSLEHNTACSMRPCSPAASLRSFQTAKPLSPLNRSFRSFAGSTVADALNPGLNSLNLGKAGSLTKPLVSPTRFAQNSPSSWIVGNTDRISFPVNGFSRSSSQSSGFVSTNHSVCGDAFESSSLFSGSAHFGPNDQTIIKPDFSGDKEVFIPRPLSPASTTVFSKRRLAQSRPDLNLSLPTYAVSEGTLKNWYI